MTARDQNETINPSSGIVSMSTRRRYLSLIGLLAVLSACGRSHGRNVFGHEEDDRLMSRCSTGSGETIALYINTAGGAAVGTSFSVTAERKPELAERQIIYSAIPAPIAIKCESKGFDLATSNGSITFGDSEVSALRAKPRNLDPGVR